MKAVTELLEKKEITVTTQAGKNRDYMISKFDAILGREMVMKYPVANMPKLGDYAVSEACMFKLMTCVAAKKPDGEWIVLETADLYRNHVPDWETGAKLEGAMWEHNCSFFANGKTLDFFGGIAQNFKGWIISTLTGLLEQSSVQDALRSKN
jgi:hypothetical protein